jgi:hypothetical protein
LPKNISAPTKKWAHQRCRAQQALFDGGFLDLKNAPTTSTALRLAASPARQQNESKPELLIGLLVWLSLAC